MLVWHDDVTSQYTRNGLPIKYEFIWGKKYNKITIERLYENVVISLFLKHTVNAMLHGNLCENINF